MSEKERRFLSVGTLIVGVVLAIYVWIAYSAKDEAHSLREQEETRSVVRALTDSVRAANELRDLLLSEQARTDSATAAEAVIAAEATAERKVDFLWKIYNEAATTRNNEAATAVFARYATDNFRRFLKQRAATLQEMLLFPLDDLASTNIWHFQHDWFAVSTTALGQSIVLRVVTAKSGKDFLIDDVQQASRPAEPLEEE